MRSRAMMTAKFPLEPAMAVIDLTDGSFDDVVAKHDIVVVDFWAPWCGRALRLGAVKWPSAGAAPSRPAVGAAWDG